MVNISVIDAHPLCAMGIESVCQSIAWVKVCGVHYSLDSFINKKLTGGVDLIILDMQLSSTDGTHTQDIERLKRYVPDAKILSVSRGHYERDRHEAYRSGSNGFASKTESLKSLKDKIEEICKGNPENKLPVRIDGDLLVIPSREADFRNFAKLTMAEKKVFTGLMNGFSITSLAEIHGRSIKTMSSHKRSLMKKMGARTDIDLFRMFSLSSVPGLAPADLRSGDKV
ncbi:TPA: response regulator transcription factor [Serratia fonticola]|nr:response regulator transcription factor [Serratia fonticola]